MTIRHLLNFVLDMRVSELVYWIAFIFLCIMGAVGLPWLSGK